MKPLILSIYFSLCLTVLSFANPPVKKVHAFKQASVPGILPRLPENENGQNEERKQSYNYWFYLEAHPKKNIQITGLWISGIKSDAKTEKVPSLPVKKIIYSGSTVNDTMTLVPPTRNQVILIYPSAIAKDTTAISKYLKDLISKHELVISYTCKGKKYYAVAKKIRVMNPDVHV